MKKTMPCVRIKLTDSKPTIFDSKIGGLGYISSDKDFPCDSEGNQLRLLAQIDCSQVDLLLAQLECQNANFENFPKSGLLQFWILNDDVSGCDFDNATKQDGFRVIYYSESEIDRTVTEQEIISKFVKNAYDDEDMHPVEQECGMLFTSGISINYDYLDEQDYEEATEQLHQIGGYPYFTQDDPREENSKYNFLLFQLDSEYWQDHYKVIWGDSGICNFFINLERLKKLDFSDILYNWDCC